MLRNVSKTLMHFCMAGALVTGLLVSCAKDQSSTPNNNYNKQTQREYSGGFNWEFGNLYLDNNNFGYCLPSSNFCHFSAANPGATGTTDLYLTAANKVEATNMVPAVFASLNISTAHSLPASFIAANGYSDIIVQTGPYPVIYDAAHPNGYYLLNVLLVP